MRKISFTFSRKRGIFSLLAVLTLFFTGIGIAFAVDSSGYPELKVPGKNTKPDAKGFYWTAPSNGVLYFSFMDPPYDNLLYTNSSFSNNVQVKEAYPEGGAVEYSWDVEKDKTYYVDCRYLSTSFQTKFESAPEEETKLQLPIGSSEYLKCEYGVNKKYYYTPSSDGVLTMNASGNLSVGNYSLIYTADGADVSMAESNGEEMGGVIRCSWAKWNLKGGQEYYFQYPTNFDEGNVKFTFEAGATAGGNQEGDGDEEEKDFGFEWNKAEIGQTYQVTNGQQMGLYITTNTGGKLVINQYGSSDPVVFTKKTDNQDDYDIMVSPETAPNQTNPVIATYSLDSKTTYYIYLKYGAYRANKIELVSYSGALEGDSDVGTGLPILPDGVITKIPKGKVYEYTCTDDGILAVEVDVYSTGFAQTGFGQFFVYKNESCSNLAKAVKIDDGTTLTGWHVELEVKAGEKYYVFNDDFDDHNFYAKLTAGGGVVAKLVDAQPQPGAAIDNSSYEATITITFEPTDVKIESVDFVYTNKQGQIVTIPNVSCQLLGGSYNIPKPQYMTTDGKRFNDPGEGSTSTEQRVSDLISDAEGSIQQYVLHKVTYNGKPVTESDLTKGVEITDDGTITLKYVIDNPPTLQNAVLPATFYQSWEAGDPDGIAILTLTKEIDNTTPIEVNIIEGRQTYGNTPGENDEIWTVPDNRIKVEGKTITVDFTGEVDFEGETLWGDSNPDTSYITLSFGQITGTNGLVANFDGNPAYMPQIPYVANQAPKPEPQVAELVSVVPENTGAIVENADGTATFELNFSVETTLNEVGFWNGRTNTWMYKYETVPAQDQYAKNWKVTMPKDYVETVSKDIDPEAKLWAYVQATTKDGEKVEFGDKAYEGWGDCDFYLCWTIEHKAPGMEFTTSLEEGNNEAPLRSFTVSSEYGKLTANNDNYVDESGKSFNPFATIVVTGPNGFNANAVSYESGDQKVILDKPMVEAGEYTITFPYMAFTITNSIGGLTEEIYNSAERTFTFNVVLGDKIYDSQVADVYVESTPAHVESVEDAENAEPIAKEDVQTIELNWQNRPLELIADDDKGGITISGPNNYFADFADDAHKYYVENSKLVIDMSSIIADIDNLIKTEFEGVDAAAYNGVYCITLKKNTVVIDAPSNARAVSNPVYNDEQYLYYNLAFDANNSKLSIEFDDQNWFPKQNEKYYFTPETAGQLTWTVYENGAETQTIVMGGIYKVGADGTAELVAPTILDGTDAGWAYTDTKSATYDLEEGVEYYFTWNKNGSGDDYSLLVTWKGEEVVTPPTLTDPQLQWEDNDFYAEGNVKYYFTTKTGGKATFSPKEYGSVVTTYIMGGLYKADGTEVKPTSISGTDWGWAYQVDQLVYDLDPETEYYFTWTKNTDGSKDYVLYAEYTGEVYTKSDVPTGVDSIFGNDGVYRVYNLQGVNVLNTENAFDINNLQPGIYVINGKKVLIRN